MVSALVHLTTEYLQPGKNILTANHCPLHDATQGLSSASLACSAVSASGSGVPGGWGPKAVFSFFQQETESQMRDIPVTGMAFSFRAGKGLATSSELSGGLLWELWCP